MNFKSKIKGKKITILPSNPTADEEFDWATAEIEWEFNFDACEWGVVDFQIKINKVDLEYDLISTDENNVSNGGIKRVIIEGPKCKVGTFLKLTKNNQLTCVIPTKVEYKHGSDECEVEF